MPPPGRPGPLGLEMVAGLAQRQPGLACQPGDDPRRESRRGVEAGTDGRSAERQLRDTGEGTFEPLDAVLDGCGVATELLAKGDRRRVHQVRTTRFHDLRECIGLAGERHGECPERRNQIVDDPTRRCEVNGAREPVVRGL